MGDLFTRRLPRIAAQSLLIVLVSKWPVTVPVTDFTIPLDPGEGPFDFKRVIDVGFEIFTTPGIAPALIFNVDDVRIDAPASSEVVPPRPKAMPWLSLLLD